jgi:hypothetical protein
MRYTPYKIPRRSSSDELLHELALALFCVLGAVCAGIIVHVIVRSL